MAASISTSLRTGAGIVMTLSDRAASTIRGRNAEAAGSGLNMIAARLSPGAISESSSSHLPPSAGSKLAKPVMFPPGRSSRGTMPKATGSPTFTPTIGIVRVCCWRAMVACNPIARMMSGCWPTNSCASASIRLMSPPAQRRSIRTLRPSVQPKSASALVNEE